MKINHSLWLPESNHHFFKFKLDNGKWITKKCENIKDLLSILKNKSVVDGYYSACLYQYPKEVDRPTSGWHGRFIAGRLCLDFDGANKDIVSQAIDFVKRNYRLSPEYLLKSRRGHYQAVFPVPNTFYRSYKESKRDGFNRYVKKIYSALETRGCPIDLRLKDMHSNRVIRLPYYPRKLSGKTIIPSFVPIPPSRGGRGDSARKMKHFPFNSNKRLASNPRPAPSPFYQAFMSSKVAGTKDRQILILSSARNKGSFGIFHFCKKNRIPEISIFHDGEKHYFLSHKTFPQARISKLYKRWYGKTKKYSYFPLTARISKKTQDKKPEYYTTLIIYEEPLSHRSRPHIEMMNKFYGQNFSYKNVHGHSHKQNIIIGRLG